MVSIGQYFPSRCHMHKQYILYYLLNLLIVINCGLLPLPSESQVAYTPGVVTSLETGLNAMASYSCSEGYDLVGDMIRTCQANGQWDGADPTCMCECINHNICP